jgi:hypothetical protein
VPDASGRTTIVPLHGRVSGIPAHRVVVRIDDAPPHALTVEGEVDESRLFGPQVRLTTSLTLVPGSNRAVLRDRLTNLGDRAVDAQLLYHWNLGPPHLEDGGRFVAPARVVVPRDARAVEGLAGYGTYGPPEPGFAEQVYYFELLASGEGQGTAVLLRNRAGDRGFALRFSTRELPCFTLWKNTGGRADGYVTGLEPASNYPNAKPFERARGRVIELEPGASWAAVTEVEALGTSAEVARVEGEIERIQGQAAPTIHGQPVEPYAPAG